MKGLAAECRPWCHLNSELRTALKDSCATNFMIRDAPMVRHQCIALASLCLDPLDILHVLLWGVLWQGLGKSFPSGIVGVQKISLMCFDTGLCNILRGAKGEEALKRSHDIPSCLKIGGCLRSIRTLRFPLTAVAVATIIECSTMGRKELGLVMF
eukprot:6101221-Amphidinium_carterae.1